MSETDIEVQDSATNESQDQELEINLDGTEDVEALKEALEKERKAKNQILARAKKAEEENKVLKKPKTPEAPQINGSSDDIDVKILKAQLIPDDQIEYLKKIAKVNEISIFDAQKDDLYKAYVEKKEAQIKSEKAKLGASRGSGTVKPEKSFKTPGLSDEEFKQMWNEKFKN